jgi:hypothetical protein
MMDEKYAEMFAKMEEVQQSKIDINFDEFKRMKEHFEMLIMDNNSQSDCSPTLRKKK